MSANSRLTLAVHALCWLELARRQGRPVLTSTEVAASLAAHPVLVRRTLAPLRDHGLVTVTGRGPGAGWRLTRPADEVTLADVHRALDEPGPFALHAHEPEQRCPVGHGIGPALTAVYADVASAIESALAARTVAGLLTTILEDHPLPRPSEAAAPLSSR